MPIKIGMVSLGCCKNQVDAEIMMSLIDKKGYELCPVPEECDVVVINTCGFIDAAKQESLETIFEFCNMKKSGNIKAVVVTGCLAERYQSEIADEIPEADVILGIGSNEKIVEAIERALDGERVVEFADKACLHIEGDRVLANEPYFAYLKVADGCNNFCTYCAIPYIRGRFRSRTIESIVEEAEGLAKLGVKEINVVAQDTTRYGEDLYGSCQLVELLSRIAKIDGIRWIRTLYCYPERITDEFLDFMASEPKMVKYLDLPLQHCNGEVLKRMNRFGDYEYLTNLMSKIREKVPGICLRTTMIAGFPGEKEEDVNELCKFIREVKFDRLGCFAYSQEEGTPAAKLPEQIDEEEKIRRADLVMREQMNVAMEKSTECVGRELDVMVEGYDEEEQVYFGRSYMDAPDVDTKTFFTYDGDIAEGTFVKVSVTQSDGYDIIGRITQIEGEKIEFAE